jgi:hypothetical protein
MIVGLLLAPCKVTGFWTFIYIFCPIKNHEPFNTVNVSNTRKDKRKKKNRQGQTLTTDRGNSPPKFI